MLDANGELPSARRPRTKVLIVLPTDLYRHGMQLSLEADDVEVIGEAATGAAALELAGQVAPDVFVIGAWLPDMSGVELTSRLLAQMPSGRVLVFSDSLDEEGVLDALSAGASGCVTRDSSPEALLEGIRGVREGWVPLPRRVAATLARRLRETPRRTAARDASAVGLSDREVEVLRLLSTGMDNVRIAWALSVSPTTVKKHVSRILAKLRVRNRVQAAVYAVRIGLAEPPSEDEGTFGERDAR
jgi:DNA-binding NarL/FixJ family response regulator